METEDYYVRRKCVAQLIALNNTIVLLIYCVRRVTIYYLFAKILFLLPIFKYNCPEVPSFIIGQGKLKCKYLISIYKLIATYINNQRHNSE
jgi:hypothetical protein